MFRLAWVLGKRSFISFTIITFMVVAVLGVTYITSRYALKIYTEAQLQRLPYDITVYQTAEIPEGEKIAGLISRIDGVKRINNYAFLRLSPPLGMRAELDEKPLVVPWISVFAATDPGLIPPEARDAAKSTLGLIGPKTAVSFDIERFRGSREFAVTELLKFYREQGDEIKFVKPEIKKLFTANISRMFHLEHAELDRWLLDQTGSTSYIPYIGAVLFTPFNWREILNLDYFFKTRSHVHVLDEEWLILRGKDETSALDGPSTVRPVSCDGRGRFLNNSKLPDTYSRRDDRFGDAVPIHSVTERSPYIPEIFHLVSIDRKRYLSGWDLTTSRENLVRLTDKVREALGTYYGPQIFVSSNSLILIDRMLEISRLLRIVTFLMALPLLWMTWIFGKNMVTLGLLRERRLIGMMRLRGVPQRFIKRVFQLFLGIGGLLGGFAGLAAGSILPLLFYEGRNFSFSLLMNIQDVTLLGIFLLVVIALALVTNRKISAFITAISPVEAASRISIHEAQKFSVRFGFFPALALILGAYKVLSWIFGFSPAAVLPAKAGIGDYLLKADYLLDLMGLPFFIYGFATLIVSSPSLLKRLLRIGIFLIGGRLKDFSLHHTSLKTHRVAAALLVAALAAGTAITPSITTSSFYDKAVRGARVQTGAAINLVFDASQFAEGELKGTLEDQLRMLETGILPSINALKGVRGIKSFDLMVEAVVPGLYVPGYGLKGIPLYLLNRPSHFLREIYFEESLGKNGSFSKIMKGLDNHKIVASPVMADFWGLSPGHTMQVGTNYQKSPVLAKAAGTVMLLPGMPQRMLEDKESYVAAQIDYLNYLFRTDAYMVADMRNPYLRELEVKVPRVNFLIYKGPEEDTSVIYKDILRQLPVSPSRRILLTEEVTRISKDMFITLTSEIMKVYLCGGLLIALIAIFATALANFSEDRRVFALLRLRGASPRDILRVVAAQLYSPVLIGLVIGGAAGILAGFGITNLIWGLRRLETVINSLTTRLIISSNSWGIFLFMIIVFGLAILCFGIWVFRRSVRESLQEK